MIDVTCALIIGHKGKILVAQRSSSMRLPLKWEFPGGKVEAGEEAGECLLREIAEELNVEVEIIRAMLPSEHDNGQQAIRLIPFICRIKSGDIQLTEHAAIVWLEPEKLDTLDWAEADIPVVQQYLAGFHPFKISPSSEN
ncbi:MAG: (deoxy)nucleoside triphosphate pyrophosphohydrolase [Pedobacter sp.]|jgi:8-oxo-dGTP diphosphatase|uniref:(deoxy)nucleoside triphosphate pyrophosphohydrolase n=1 Tax=Pedobacter sp. TaxID=1411316 RepID=UPI0033992B72